jgi:hypothetical protein
MMRLRVLLAKRRADLLTADPLVELHDDEENANTALRQVIAEFRALAVEFDIAVILVHHTRKGEITPGDLDSARGASAIGGAVRIAKTIIGMSEDDADVLGLPVDRRTRSRYFRLDDAKQTYAEIGAGRWYEKSLYVFDNGEAVPAAVPWAAPNLWEKIPTSVANKILDEIDAGLDGGKQRFSGAPAATERAAWPVVTRHALSLTEGQARKLIKTWVKNGVLVSRDYEDETDRKTRKGLYVNNAKRPGPNSP